MWRESLGLKEKGRQKKKIYICDLILLPGSSYNYLQPEDLQAPTGDKNTENTSEKRHSNYLLEEHPGCQDCVIQKVIHAMIPSKQSSTLTYWLLSSETTERYEGSSIV